MSIEHDNAACAASADELLRVAASEISLTSASASARQHLANCSDCTEEFRENATLLADISYALRPVPLDAALHGRILASANAIAANQSRRVPAPVLFTLRPSLAAAAALIAIVSWHTALSHRQKAASDAASAIAAQLAAQDAADIASAFRYAAETGGSTAVNVSSDPLDRVRDAVSSIEKSLQGERTGASLLPWTSSDDWDLPREGRTQRAPTPLLVSRASIFEEIGS